MKISVLAENTAKNDCYGAEHGLSMYLEIGEEKILFDTGASSLFIENAKKLGIDLSQVDKVIISHGHNDHGGGLQSFFCINPKAKAFVTARAFGRYFNDSNKDISIDAGLLSTGRFVVYDEKLELMDNVEVLTCNNAKPRTAINCYGLKMVENSCLVDDDFKHEQYMVVEENGKRIVFSGCSHKGIINICEWLQPDVLIGGFHFMRIDDDKILQEAADQLNAFNADFYTCHCTGLKQYECLKQKMPRLHYLSSGDVLEIK